MTISNNHIMNTEFVQDVYFIKKYINHKNIKTDQLWKNINIWKKNNTNLLYEMCTELRKPYFKKVQFDSAFYLIANNNIIGYLIYKVIDYKHNTDEILIICKIIAVHSSYRNKGHGKYIMKQWEVIMRKIYCTKKISEHTSPVVNLILHDESNIPGFYWRLGYSVSNDYNDIIKNEENIDDADVKDVFIKIIFT
jgi:ribosomal protein S18 acetylase RimI-like enzyme